MSVHPEAVTLDGELTLEQAAAIGAGARIELAPEALERVAANRATLERILSTGTPVYGISTGFGALVSNTVAPELQRHLQVNLLRSHAAGTGDDLPDDVVRLAMAVRCNGLLLGHSGVRPAVIERIVQLLNGGYAAARWAPAATWRRARTRSCRCWGRGRCAIRPAPGCPAPTRCGRSGSIPSSSRAKRAWR
jgi:hypothetical protein